MIYIFGKKAALSFSTKVDKSPFFGILCTKNLVMKFFLDFALKTYQILSLTQSMFVKKKNNWAQNKFWPLYGISSGLPPEKSARKKRSCNILFQFIANYRAANTPQGTHEVFTSHSSLNNVRMCCIDFKRKAC